MLSSISISSENSVPFICSNWGSTDVLLPGCSWRFFTVMSFFCCYVHYLYIFFIYIFRVLCSPISISPNISNWVFVFLSFYPTTQLPNYPTLCFSVKLQQISQWNIYFLAPLSQVRFVISFRFYFLCCSLKCLLVCSVSLFLHSFSTECFFCFILLANAPEKLQHNLWNLCFLLLFPCLLSVHTEFTMLVLKCLLVSLSLFPT